MPLKPPGLNEPPAFWEKWPPARSPQNLQKRILMQNSSKTPRRTILTLSIHKFLFVVKTERTRIATGGPEFYCPQF